MLGFFYIFASYFEVHKIFNEFVRKCHPAIFQYEWYENSNSVGKKKKFYKIDTRPCPSADDREAPARGSKIPSPGRIFSNYFYMASKSYVSMINLWLNKIIFDEERLCLGKSTAILSATAFPLSALLMLR